MTNGEEVLSIQGLSVNLPVALFGTSKEARCINGVDFSISNGHWAVYSGSPDLSLIRKAAEKRAKNGEIDWKTPKSYTLADIKGQSWGSEYDIKKHLHQLYQGKRYALVDDYMVLNNTGTTVGVHAYTPMTCIGEDEYKPARKDMDEPYEVWFDPKYYIAFRKLGFDFLIGPGSWATKMVSEWDAERGEQVEIKEKVHKPQVALLVRWVGDIFQVRGCLMPMTSPE